MTEEEVKLLRECNLGSKMALNSIRRVVEDVKSEDLKHVLYHSLRDHEKLGDRFHELLSEVGEEPKEPNFMEQSSIVMSIGMKLMMENTDEKIAEIMNDGAEMGIKKIKEYLHKWGGQDERVSEVAEKLIEIEEDFSNKLKEFL